MRNTLLPITTIATILIASCGGGGDTPASNNNSAPTIFTPNIIATYLKPQALTAHDFSFGDHVMSIDDINADGFPELVLSDADNEVLGELRAGTVYFMNGDPADTQWLFAASGDAALQSFAEDGFIIVDDINGDGGNELLISNSRYEDLGATAGRAVLVDQATGERTWAYPGVGPGEYLGRIMLVGPGSIYFGVPGMGGGDGGVDAVDPTNGLWDRTLRNGIVADTGAGWAVATNPSKSKLAFSSPFAAPWEVQIIMTDGVDEDWTYSCGEDAALGAKICFLYTSAGGERLLAHGPTYNDGLIGWVGLYDAIDVATGVRDWRAFGDVEIFGNFSTLKPASDIDNDGNQDFYYFGLGPAVSLVEARSGADGSLIWSKTGGVEYFLYSMIVIDDTNGDGVQDVVVVIWDGLQQSSNVVQILDGADGTLLAEFDDPELGVQVGNSIHQVADYDGDGIRDIAVQQRFGSSNGGFNASSVHIISAAQGD